MFAFLKLKRRPRIILKMWEHTSWGNNLQFTKWEHPKGKVVGWLTNKPRTGDELLAKFTKGVVALKIVRVEPCGDPHDMFFADVKYIGHLDYAGSNETPETYIRKQMGGG